MINTIELKKENWIFFFGIVYVFGNKKMCCKKNVLN